MMRMIPHSPPRMQRPRASAAFGKAPPPPLEEGGCEGVHYCTGVLMYCYTAANFAIAINEAMRPHL